MSNSTKKMSSDDAPTNISRSLRNETTHRRNGLPATRTPERKANKNINNNINNKSNNKTCRNKNSKINNNNNNYNNNNTHIGNSERSTRCNHNNSHRINSGKNTSNVNNKTNLANNNGITAVNIKNTNTSRKCNELDSTLNSTRSKANTNASSTMVARDDGRGGAGEGAEGGGHDAGEEAWPCPTPCPTRCSSLDEESTFEFRQATINAAINTAMDRVKTVAQEGARAVLVDAAKQIQEEMKTKMKDFLKSNEKEETDNKTVPEDAEKEMEKKMEDIQEAVKPNAKEEIINKTVSQEIEVKERDSESIELKGKDGKTNIISGMMQDRLSRVAISLPDGAKSQFLKIRQWHVNKKGHLVLDCSLPLGGNEGAVKKEMSDTPSSKDAVKCHFDLSATDSVVSTPVFSTILKNRCIDPSLLSQHPSLNMNNSDKTYAPPTNLQFEAQATTKSTSQGSQRPLTTVDTASTPLGVTLTFAPSKSKDVASTATLASIPITISTMTVNHTTMIPLDSIAMEQQYVSDQDPDLHCLRRNPTSLEDLLAVLRSTCAPSAEGSPSSESVYAHRPRKKLVAHKSRTNTRRRESCWRRPCSVLRALATALRLHKSPICADCALRHGGVGASDAFDDGSGSEDERQPAANTDAPRNTHNVTESLRNYPEASLVVYQTSQKRYEWGEKETEGSEDETRNKPSTGRSRSSTAPPRKNAILVDTGCDPRSAEAHSRTPPTPTPSPVEVAPRTCPDAAIGTGKTRDWLDDSAKNDASRDKINQSSVESIKREPSNTCNIVKNLRIKESPTPLPVGIELPQPHKTVTKTKKIQSATAPECPWCSRNAPTNCAMCQRASTLSWGKGSCTLCNKAASKSSTGIIRKPSTVTATRTAPPSTAERRGDKGRAAPVRSKPVPAKAVRHSARTHKRRAPKSRDRNRSTSRSMPAKHRSVSGRQRAKRRSISISHQRKQRSQSNSHRGKPRSTSQSFREKQIVPSASNRTRIRSLSQPQHRELHSTPDPHRARSHSMSRLKRANQHSTSSSLHKFNRSRSQSQNRKRRSTSKSRRVPHRSLWKTDRAQPSGSSRRPTTRVRAGTRRKQLNTVPHRRKAGLRVVSTRRGNTQTLGYPKGLRRPHGIRVMQKRVAHHEDSATSLSSGSSVTSGSSSSSGSARWSASASSTDSRVGALTAYCQTRDPTYIRECILRHLLRDRVKKFALTGPKDTASRSRVRMMKKGSK